MKKTIYIARVADDNSDAYRAFFGFDAAADCARSYAAHLTARELKTHTVTLEGYPTAIEDDDPRDAETLWHDLLNDDDSVTYDPEIYKEYQGSGRWIEKANRLAIEDKKETEEAIKTLEVHVGAAIGHLCNEMEHEKADEVNSAWALIKDTIRQLQDSL